MHAVSYNFWDSATANVELPNHFLIDEEQQAIIVAAKNSIGHLSLDLQHSSNFHDASPDSSTFYDCHMEDLRTVEQCQNYHHVLVYPKGPGAMISMQGVRHNLNDTVLVCGSYAFSPMCHYRQVRNCTSQLCH